MVFLDKLFDSYKKKRGAATKQAALDAAVAALPEDTTSPVWRIKGIPGRRRLNNQWLILLECSSRHVRRHVCRHVVHGYAQHDETRTIALRSFSWSETS
jgi:hypothetical protein